MAQDLDFNGIDPLPATPDLAPISVSFTAHSPSITSPPQTQHVHRASVPAQLPSPQTSLPRTSSLPPQPNSPAPTPPPSSSVHPTASPDTTQHLSDSGSGISEAADDTGGLLHIRTSFLYFRCTGTL